MFLSIRIRFAHCFGHVKAPLMGTQSPKRLDLVGLRYILNIFEFPFGHLLGINQFFSLLLLNKEKFASELACLLPSRR